MPWNVHYRENFRFTLTMNSPVVIVLSQLGGRYFRGLEGQYRFTLNFGLHSIDNLDGDAYVARSHGKACMKRSVAFDLPELSKGTYCVFIKVRADRLTGLDSVERVVEDMCREKGSNEKFSQVGMLYNIAHAKGAKHMESQMKMRMDEEWKKKAREERLVRRIHRIRKQEEKSLQQMIPNTAAKTKIPTGIPTPGGIRTSSTSKQADAIMAKPSTTASLRSTAALQRSENASEQVSAQGESEPIPTVDTAPLQPAPNALLQRPSISILYEGHEDSSPLPSSPLLADSEDDSSSASDYQRAKLHYLSYGPPTGDDENDVDP